MHKERKRKSWEKSRHDRCHRFYNEREENWLELSGCHGARGCLVCLCVSRLALWSKAAISRQTTGGISKLCLLSFSQLRWNLIFTACLSLCHTSQDVGNPARLVHWMSETCTHARSLSSYPQCPPPAFSHPSNLNLSGTAIKTQRNAKLQLRYCCDCSRLQSENRADAKRKERV